MDASLEPNEPDVAALEAQSTRDASTAASRSEISTVQTRALHDSLMDASNTAVQPALRLPSNEDLMADSSAFMRLFAHHSAP